MEAGEKSITSQDANRLLKRGVAEIIIEEEMAELLRSGKKLRLKEGFDPSFPDIHLGHMVALRKLHQFQELGHQVILIVGDWTAQIGDPSGASTTRPMLSAEQVQANAETYMKQFFKVVDRKRTEVRWQSEWFGKFTLSDVIQLTSKFTIAQFLAREDFSKRYNEGRPIAITELLYPLLQAYDSVAIQADVEFGGTDQKFNLLVGRELQSMMGQHPQQIFLVPILIGTDGSQKMSKSLGNYIGVAELPNEIYGKVMSIPDSLILSYFELVTDIPDEELVLFSLQLSDKNFNPMTLKKRLAREIVTQLYDQKAASEAEEHFTRIVQKREIPKDIEKEYRISFKEVKNSGESFDIRRLLTATGLVKSNSEATRLIKQGAVEIDGQTLQEGPAMPSIAEAGRPTERGIPMGELAMPGRVDDRYALADYRYPALIQDGTVIKVGKRRFAKVINTDTITQ